MAGILPAACAATICRRRRRLLSPLRRLAAVILTPLVVLPVFMMLSVMPARARQAQDAEARQLFERAYSDQKRGETASAVAEYRKFLQTYPQSQAVLMVRANLAAALATLGQFDQAIAQYQKALKDAPGNPELRFSLGLAYFNQGDFRSAAATLGPLQSERPDDVRLAALLGNCQVHLGQFQQAIALLAPLEKKHPDDLGLEWALGQALIQSGHSSEGLARIQKVADQGRDAEAYQIAAGLNLGLTRFDIARRDAESAIRLNPRLPKAHVVLGMIQDYVGKEQEAEQEFRKALELDPGDLRARMELASVLYNQGKLEPARSQLEAVLAKDPQLKTAHYLLGRIDRAEGKLQAALKDFQTAEQRDPNWISPHIELTTLYYRLKQPAEGAKEMRIVKQLRAKGRAAQPDTRAMEPHAPGEAH